SALGAAVSLLLRLVGRDHDPARSREHVLLSLLAERRLRSGADSTLEALIEDLEHPPIAEVGAMDLDAFLSKRDRRDLAGALNALLASPTFSSWRRGADMNVGEWMAARPDGRTPATIVSVAHLDDDERMLVLGMVLEEVLGWVRGLSGTSALRGLVVFDEVYGFVPPHPANPPTKRPLVSLMKQARAFGVGVIVATQDPMDVDYRALANAGMWWVGRLQTDADRARVVEGLASVRATVGGVIDLKRVGDVVKRLAPRWFVMRDAHDGAGARLVEAREAMAWLRGPMTRGEVATARRAR
ncbi:MAG: ATP-binding protein, partial [Deltaproteobacteria bacterium]